MPERKHKVGYIQPNGTSFMVNARFKKHGVPRLYRSSGTSDAKTFAAIKTMLADLGSLDTPEATTLVRKLADGSLTFLDALATYRQDGRKGMIAKHAHVDSPVSEKSFNHWLDRHDVTENTRINYRWAFKALQRYIKVADSMDTLPTVLKRYREDCILNDRNRRAFDNALAVCKAWVKGVQDDESETYRKLRKVKRFGKKPDPRKKRYFSPRDVMNVCDEVPTSIKQMLWGMAVTGMHYKEYMVDGWEIEGNGVHIFGEKTDHRNRIVPLLPNHVPLMPDLDFKYKSAWSYITTASGKKMTVNGPRNSYPRWLASAGIPWNRIKMYQGHTASEMTDTYAFYNVTQEELRADGELLQKWIESELEREPRPVKPEKPYRERKGTILTTA
jgi:hypothetical protein